MNGLSDVTIENTNENAYFVEIPASRSGDLGNLGLGVDALENLTGGDYNLAIGANALNTLTTSQNATAVGYNAGAAAGTNLMGDTTLIGNSAGFGRSGYRTVAIGSGAMGFGSGKTAVNRNTAIGYHALYRIDTNGADNVALGHEASQFLTTATKNIAIGDNAGRSSTATGHISIGYHAGYSQTSGVTNTNVGYRAGYSTTTNGDNTYIGYQSGYSATGARNSSLGDGAFGGGFGHSGTDNVAFGYRALQQPSGASNYNVAIGSDALRGSGTKSENVAIGYQAGTAVTSGGRLVIIGSEAGSTLTTSIRSVIIGHDAGKSITDNGWDSVHIGDAAGQNVTGQKNTSVGKDAMLKASGTSDNSECTAIGQRALRALRTGNQNTALGASAGDEMQTGSNSTMIGYHAQASSTSASNEITLGDSNIATLRCAVTSITSLSDERDKSEIKDLQYGLDFINSLQPREFIWNNRAETRTNTDIDGNETEVEFYSANKGKKDFGFIAQEVQSVDDDTLRLVYDENPDKLEMSYGKLVPVLVQAIKELKAEVELLKA